jgi:hypothetical protein
MIDRLTLGASAATTQPLHDLLQRQIVAQDGIQVDPLRFEQGIELLGLSHSSRKTVEQESAPTAQAADPFLNHGNNHAIGDQFASPHRVQSRF